MKNECHYTNNDSKNVNKSSENQKVKICSSLIHILDNDKNLQ